MTDTNDTTELERTLRLAANSFRKEGDPMLADVIAEAASALSASRERERKMVEALTFYANEASWHDHEWEYERPNGDMAVAAAIPVDEDRGERARAALAITKTEATNEQRD